MAEPDQTALDSKKILAGLLERIIFNDKDFIRIKTALASFSSGTIPSRDVKEVILQCRERMLRELLGILPMYAHHSAGTPHTPVPPEMLDDLSEKNAFLTELGTRVAAIAQKLSLREAD